MDSAKGKVSVWINTVSVTAYPASYFEENYERDDNEPICEWAGNFGFKWYDHDFMDVARTEGQPQPIRELLKRCSYINTFVDKLEKRALANGIGKANHAIFLYDFNYAAPKSKIKEDGYMRFLGTFEYNDSSD